MKLQNFIIGIGIFAVFTIIIFGAINPDNARSIYGSDYLNVTVDANTTAKIKVLRFDVGHNASVDFGIVESEIGDFTSNRSLGGEQTEDNLLAEGRKMLFAVPKFFQTIGHSMGEMSSVLGIPNIFQAWVVNSFVIIIVLIIATAFLRNRLQS